MEKRSAPFKDEAAVEDDNDDDDDELDKYEDELVEDDGDLVKVGRLEDLEGDRVGSPSPASLYRPSLLRKS